MCVVTLHVLYVWSVGYQSMSQPVTASEPVSMVAPLPAGKRAVSEAVQVEPNNIPSKTCPIGNQHLQSGSSTCDLLNLGRHFL